MLRMNFLTSPLMWFDLLELLTAKMGRNMARLFISVRLQFHLSGWNMDEYGYVAHMVQSLDTPIIRRSILFNTNNSLKSVVPIAS